VKRVPSIQIISGSGALNRPTTIDQPGDRGCVSCGTIYHADWYISGAAHETLIVDARGRYWCLDCAVKDLANVGRRVDDRTDYLYPWSYQDTGGLAGQHARVKAIPGAKQCPKCGVQSGDDWHQCEGQCPMPGSPHYNAGCVRAFEDACTVGAGVASRSYTREVAATIAAKANATRDPLIVEVPTVLTRIDTQLKAQPREPEFSYVRLPGGKSTVTCACGWKDPLGPVAPSPFDPQEALAAAYAAHPRCPTPYRGVIPIDCEMADCPGCHRCS